MAGVAAQGARLAIYFATWDENGWLLALRRAVHPRRGDPVPTVLSISWAESEFGVSNSLSWSRAAMDAISGTFQEAAAFGLTVLVASGDQGSDCQQGDGRAHVYYPASDPWVTACGGTAIEVVSTSLFKETTWNENGVTGGGISDCFDIPKWQEEAGIPRSINPGSRRGRGVPDIAGYANGYPIVQGGTIKNPAKGTSEVAPLYAGLIANINAIIKTPIGFMNPTLYSLGETLVFHDIHDGITNSYDGAPGYKAGRGWDACTGWGSINGTELLKVLQGHGGRKP